MNIRSGNRLIGLAALAALVALASTAWATITDDINPFGPHVRVTLRNTLSSAVEGTVYVTANIQSAGPAVQTVSAKYSIAPNDKVDVVVDFSGKVKEVTEVKPVDESK